MFIHVTVDSTANNSDDDDADSDDSAQGVSSSSQRIKTPSSRKTKKLLGQPLPMDEVPVVALKQALRECLAMFDLSRVSGRFGDDAIEFVVGVVDEEAKASHVENKKDEDGQGGEEATTGQDKSSHDASKVGLEPFLRRLAATGGEIMTP